MNKITYLLLALIFLPHGLFAQDKTREEVIQLMAEDTCECIKKDEESFSKEKSMNQKQVALGLCLFESYSQRKLESEKMKDSGMDDFEALGEEVGIKMVSTCGTEFMALFTNEQLGEIVDEAMEDDNDLIIAPPPPAPKNENDLQLEAELVSLSNDAISYFEVKDTFNKTHVFLIKEQFEGYELLKKSNFSKSLKIYYKEIDMFDLSERKYVKKKVVKYLEIID